MKTREVYPTVDVLLDALAAGGPWRRMPMDKHADSLSGAPFERAELGTERYVIKYLGHDLDWLMRAFGDGADGREPYALILWRHGILDALPPELDPVIVGMAYDPATGRVAQVMRDISSTLVPADDTVVPLAQHRRFLDHMATMHAAFWGFTDRYQLLSLVRRYGFAHPDVSAREAAAGQHDPIPTMFPGGWAAVAQLAPEAARLALQLSADATPLGNALAATPATLVHGDWKYGNLGSTSDGRTVLLDWAAPGEAGPAVDLAWYLAVNCDRLPESKEDTIVAFRDRLRERGVDSTGWWDRQLELALLGAFVQLGWSKPGNPAELHWWVDRVLPTARALLA